jgi:hypothetical protein
VEEKQGMELLGRWSQGLPLLGRDWGWDEAQAGVQAEVQAEVH